MFLESWTVAAIPIFFTYLTVHVTARYYWKKRARRLALEESERQRTYAFLIDMPVDELDRLADRLVDGDPKWFLPLPNQGSITPKKQVAAALKKLAVNARRSGISMHDATKLMVTPSN